MTDASHVPNFRSAAAQMRQGESLFRGLFERAPLPLLVLTPDLRIVNANDAWLTAVDRRRDALVGLDLFVAMPDNPHDPGATGVHNLGASLERVLRSGERDLMPMQRYDVRPDGQPWEVRYWHPANWSVVDEAVSVLALVHHVTDVTSNILGKRSFGRLEPSTDMLITRADAAMREARAARNDVKETRLRVRETTRLLLRRSDTR